MEAVKRGKPHPLTEESELLAATGWTPTQLSRQPARSVELLRAYLAAAAASRDAERRRAEQAMEDQIRRIRQ